MKHLPTILVFGNPLLNQDSLPLKILPNLKQKFPNIQFKEIDPTEDIELLLNTDTPNTKHQTPGNFVAIDTIKNINQITIIDDIDKLKTTKLYSMHDFDLALNLKLLKKLNKINLIKIIGVPMNISEDEALFALVHTIRNLFSDVQRNF